MTKHRNYHHKSIYLTPAEYKSVKDKITGSGISFSSFARSLLTTKKPVNKRSIPMEQFRELSAIGNNLNQLARVANQSGQIPEDFTCLFSGLKSHLQTIQEALK